ncbi:hypothetical protein [Albidovulum sp.]|uniref:hypothetical protein n=1 Tax=Albidovulum sp. TaxID=1872424 RepID=UPI0039B9ACC8
MKQLREIYDYGNSPQPNPRRPIDPSGFGYGKPLYREEYWAEAIRQYMAAPDTMKARFPQVAARIREYVYSNPKIMDLIQFNVWGVPAGGLAAGPLTGLDPSLEDDTRSYLGAIYGQ